MPTRSMLEAVGALGGVAGGHRLFPPGLQSPADKQSKLGIKTSPVPTSRQPVFQTYSKHACCCHGPKLPGEISQGLWSSGDGAWPRHDLPTRGPATPPDLPDERGGRHEAPRLGCPWRGPGTTQPAWGAPRPSGPENKHPPACPSPPPESQPQAPPRPVGGRLREPPPARAPGGPDPGLPPARIPGGPAGVMPGTGHSAAVDSRQTAAWPSAGGQRGAGGQARAVGTSRGRHLHRVVVRGLGAQGQVGGAACEERGMEAGPSQSPPTSPASESTRGRQEELLSGVSAPSPPQHPMQGQARHGALGPLSPLGRPPLP